MEKLKRTIFFWLLVLIFAIAAPAVVFYAKGYRFDLIRGIFVHSGTISVKSNPQNISVALNGKEIDAKILNRINNSYTIGGLDPKNYSLLLNAEGYQPWNKSVDIHSGLASEFWNVILVKNNYAVTSYETPSIEKFFISPKSDFIAYAKKNESPLEVDILDIEKKEVTSSFDFFQWNLIPEEKKENIEWSPKGDYLSVPVSENASSSSSEKKLSDTEPTENPYRYLIIDTQEKTFFNLNETLKNNDISYVRWDPRDKDYLFYLSKHVLYRSNIKNPGETVEIAHDVSSFDLSKTNVYYSQMPHELVYKSNLDGSGNHNQITSDFPEDISKNFRLIVYDDNRIAFFTENKTVYVFNVGQFDTYFRKLGSDIEGIQFSDDGKKLLYWTKNQISTYYLRSWNVQPTRNEDSLEDIVRYSEEIHNIQWFKDYEHIIFSVGNKIKFIELDPRDHRNSMDILSTASNSPIVGYDHYLEKMFFIDNKSADTRLYSIIFPEEKLLLGIFGNQNE